MGIEELEDDPRTEDEGADSHGRATTKAVCERPDNQATKQRRGLLDAYCDSTNSCLIGGGIPKGAMEGVEGENSAWI